jgi:hypothetical protein
LQQPYELKLKTRYAAVPVPEQLPQITIFRTGCPDARRVIFQQQLRQKLGILAVGLLLADALGLDLRRITNATHPELA